MPSQLPDKSTIYFKPGNTMTVQGVKYENGESYPLNPGESFNHPIDGIAAPHLDSERVYKVTDGNFVTVTNDNLSIKSKSPIHSVVNMLRGGWKGENWLNRLNSIPIYNSSATHIPYKPIGISDNSWNNLFQRIGIQVK